MWCWFVSRTLKRDNFTLKISEKCYAEKVVDKEEAKDLLRRSNNINMVGKEIISLSVDMGIGSQNGVKKIDGVPFLLVFKMWIITII